MNEGLSNRSVHGDGLSSTQLVTDKNGAQAARVVFGAWGDTLSSNDSVPGGLDVRFVGGLGVRNDSTTGLIYMRHRWYDAELGRFLSRDPIGHAGGLNLYSAMANNPATHIDPSGLIPLVLAGPVVVDTTATLVILATPFVLAGAHKAGKFIGETVADASASVIADTAVSTFVSGLPPGMGSAMQDKKYMSSPWNDPSMHWGQNNIHSMKSSDPCDKVSLKGKSVSAGKKKLEEVGLTETPGSRKGGRGWTDVTGKVRAAWDRATKMWGSHWHKFDANGNPLNNAGRPVKSSDPAAHIPDGTRRVVRKKSRSSTTPIKKAQIFDD